MYQGELLPVGSGDIDDFACAVARYRYQLCVFLLSV